MEHLAEKLKNLTEEEMSSLQSHLEDKSDVVVFKTETTKPTQKQCLQDHAGEAGVCVNGAWIPAG